MKLRINGEYHEIDAQPGETLLHVLRDHLNLKGTSNGCMPEECKGTCTILVNGRAQSSCRITVGSLNGDRIRTIEGIPDDHPVRKAWVTEEVEECEHCKSSQIMNTISLLARMLNPSPEDIREALNCACGKDIRVIRAVNKASKSCYDS